MNKLTRFTCCILLLLTAIAPSFAQSLEKLKQQAMNTREIILTKGDSIETFSLAPRGAEGKATDSRSVYWWYGGSEIHRTQGAAGGRLLQGEYSLFNSRKDLLERGHYDDGKKTGEWRYWYVNGNIRQVSQWKRGMLQGNFIEYYPDGNTLREGSYKAGRLHGKLKETDLAGHTVQRKYKHGIEKLKKAPKADDSKPGKIRTAFRTSYRTLKGTVISAKGKLKQKLAERKLRREQARVSKGEKPENISK